MKLGLITVSSGMSMGLRNRALLALGLAHATLLVAPARAVGPEGVERDLEDGVNLLESTALGLRKEEKGIHKRQDGYTSKDPADLEVGCYNRVGNGEVGHEGPEDVPGNSDRLRLLTESGIRDLATGEVRDGRATKHKEAKLAPSWLPRQKVRKGGPGQPLTL